MGGPSTLFSAGGDGIVGVWSLTTLSNLAVHTQHSNPVSALARGHGVVVSLSSNVQGEGQLVTFCASTGAHVRTELLHLAGPTMICSAHIVGRKMFTTSLGDDTLAVWNVNDGTREHTLASSSQPGEDASDASTDDYESHSTPLFHTIAFAHARAATVGLFGQMLSSVGGGRLVTW